MSSTTATTTTTMSSSSLAATVTVVGSSEIKATTQQASSSSSSSAAAAVISSKDQNVYVLMGVTGQVGGVALKYLVDVIKTKDANIHIRAILRDNSKASSVLAAGNLTLYYIIHSFIHHTHTTLSRHHIVNQRVMFAISILI
jgi:hypothetical protein